MATASTRVWRRTTARFNGEQRALAAGDGFVDLSHRDVVRISGPDRLTWLHSLTTQYFEGLAAGVWTEALILSPQGHVEHAFDGVDDGEAFTAHTEPGLAAPLVEFLDRMRFMMRVEVADVTDELAVAWRPARRRADAPLRPRPPRPPGGVRRRGGAGVRPVGLRGAADRARRAAVRARHRPPHDPQRGRLDRPGRAPGQGLLPRPGDRRPRAHARPAAAPADPAAPRRLREPAARRRRRRSADGERWVGFVGSSARHYELGPIALAWSSATCRSTPTLDADGMPAGQEIVVDPEVGLHVRPLR